LALIEKERHESGNVKMAAKDDDYYLSCHRELNVVPVRLLGLHLTDVWALHSSLAQKKADAEADRKTVLSLPRRMVCAASQGRYFQPTIPAILLEAKIAAIARQPKRDCLD
jgi:hypothetical protein